ncbi:MAG: nitroreductase family deazaflavin-dependent oxidoreductase [Labedaea sp.]
MGWPFGRRLLYLVHRGRRTGARREVVVEIVGDDPAVPEVVVVATWGRDPDRYQNLRADSAIEVRVGTQRWAHPAHRFLDAAGTVRALRPCWWAHPHVEAHRAAAGVSRRSR